MKFLLKPTEFDPARGEYKSEWFETDYLFTPDGNKNWPNHHCKSTFQTSFPFISKMRNALDIGCRVGEYTRYLQHHFEHTYAFDPNLWPDFACNVDLDKTTHFNCAIGDEEGSIEMSSGTHQYVEGKMKVKPVFRIDDFNFEDIDYMKIDVEGFERKVLVGSAELIEKCEPLIIIEQNAVTLPGEGIYAAKEWLEERGYKHVATCKRGWDYIMQKNSDL